MIDVLGGISNPLIESGTVGGIGVILLAFRRWRTGAALIVAAAIWAWLCATPAFGLLMWQGLANQYPSRPPSDYPRADAIVLVGGGPVPRPLDEWNAEKNPALSTPLGFALALYRSGRAPLLVATGNYGRQPTRRALTRQGVPQALLRQEPASETTHQDAWYAQRALHHCDRPSILLVGTALHMPRMVATFRKNGFDVTAAPAEEPAWLSRISRPWHPRKFGLHLSQASLHEYIGLFYYRLRGWAEW